MGCAHVQTAPIPAIGGVPVKHGEPGTVWSSVWFKYAHKVHNIPIYIYLYLLLLLFFLYIYIYIFFFRTSRQIQAGIGRALRTGADMHTNLPTAHPCCPVSALVCTWQSLRSCNINTAAASGHQRQPGWVQSSLLYYIQGSGHEGFNPHAGGTAF